MSKQAKLYTISGFLLIIGIAVSDILSTYFIFFGKLGTILWFATFLFLIIFALRCFKNLIYLAFKKVSLLTLFVIFTFIFLVSSQINNPASLSGETTIETECTLDHLANSDDIGFRKTCLFGYPARQYFLPALPTVLFGRSLASLNLGGGLYFLIGIVIFAYGFFRYFGRKKSTDLLASLALASLFHFYYFNHFLFIFEQSVFPLSFGLILTGVLMEYSKTYNKSLLIPLVITLLYLTSSYTPSLALLGLALLILVPISLKAKDRLSKAAIWFTIAATLSIFAGTSLFRQDISIIESSRTPTQLISDVKQSLEHFINPSEGAPYTSVIYRYLFILVLGISLLGLAGYSGVFMALWILGVILFSIISKGYIYYALGFRLHRALVALPVLLFLLSKLFNRLLINNIGTKLLAGFSIFIIVSGLIYNQKFLGNRRPNPQYAYINWIKTNLDTKSASNLYITHEAGNHNNLITLSDTLRYFIPSIKAVYIPTAEILNNDCYPKDNINGMILLPEDHYCHHTLNVMSAAPPGNRIFDILSATSPNFANLGNFRSDTNVNLTLFEARQ